MPYQVLIVDDNSQYRQSLKDALHDYEITETSNGEEALQILKRPHEFDLVVLDERMPGISGVEVLEEIKKKAPELKAMILTGCGTEDLAVQALRAQADDYVRKTSPFVQVERRIRALAESEKKPDPAQTAKGESARIGRIKYFIEKNYHKNLHLSDAAERLYLSPKYLSRLFKQSTRMTFNAYKITVRIQKAKELLEQGELNINQISERVGYLNAESFIKAFEKAVGSTPTEYRKRMQKVREQKGLKAAERKMAGLSAKSLDSFYAHELRNSLSVIRAAAYNIKRKVSSSQAAKELTAIDRVLSDADVIIENAFKRQGRSLRPLAKPVRVRKSL